jgi:hypothetical protein
MRLHAKLGDLSQSPSNGHSPVLIQLEVEDCDMVVESWLLPTGGGMTVLRITANIAADTVPETRKFYSDLFGLDAVMDLGWIVTLSSRETTFPQISILSEGGSGAPVPDVSIEVDNVNECIVVRKRSVSGWSTI